MAKSLYVSGWVCLGGGGASLDMVSVCVAEVAMYVKVGGGGVL